MDNQKCPFDTFANCEGIIHTNYSYHFHLIEHLFLPQKYEKINILTKINNQYYGITRFFS